MRGEIPGRAKWLLAIVDLSGRVEGSTRLQKLAFLANQMIPELARFDFYSDWKPSKYGPFSPTLAEDVDGLESRKLLDKEQVEFAETSRLDRYSATPEGKTLASQFESTMPDITNQLQKHIISKYAAMPLMDLLHAVYYQFPEYTVESRIAGEIFGISKAKQKEVEKEKAILFLDQQSLGLKPFLEGKCREIRDITEILGHKDTREGVPDEQIIEYLKEHPYTLVTKDRRLAKQCERLDLNVICVDESEAVANEVLRRIAE